MAITPDDNLLQASPSDIEVIVSLVNRAFAVESFFKSGDRTDELQIREMLVHGEFLLLLDASTVIACVYVKLNGERAYIGMLAVDPAKQKLGIGVRMMRKAEDFARGAGCKFADIRVVSVRPELPLIYGKLGYVESGLESAAVIKIATMPVHFVKMTKPL